VLRRDLGSRLAADERPRLVALDAAVFIIDLDARVIALLSRPMAVVVRTLGQRHR
jgi:hypothetical protein